MLSIFRKTTAFILIFLTVLTSPGLFPSFFDIFGAAPQVAQAAFNSQINYQGKLTDSLGVTVADGTYHMMFRLYTSAVSATTTNIWEEDRSAIAGDRVTVTNGLFSLMLGSSTPLTSVDFNQTLYLGVEIGGSGGSPSWDGEMSPRKILGAVPAAFVAKNVNDGAIENTSIGSTTPSTARFTNATATNATTTSFFSTTASSTNLFSTSFSLGSGVFGNSTSTNATTTNAFVTSFLSTSATSSSFFSTTASSTNLFSTSFSLGNGVFGNSTSTSATTTSLAISSIASSILKTNTNGSVIPAIAGTDYLASAITSLGPTGQTQTGSTQTLATSTSGSDFTITASGDTQTFNLPFSSATANGKLSSTDWSIFNNKISSSSLSGTDPITYSSATGAIGFNFGFNGTYTGANIFDNITRSTTTSATTTNAFVTSLLSTSATSSSFFSTTASSTNLFFSVANGGNLTSSGLGTFSNILTTASSTLQNFTALKSTSTNATTTSLSISSIASSILKTNANGSVIPAIAGTDYLASAITALGPTGQTQTGSTQTLATSTSGSDFTITASGDTQTFNLPFSSATANGKLSSTDWSIFNNKISSSSIDTSTELANLITDETGSGALVFATLPTLSGFISNASSTIGNGTQAGGLLVSGGATTTGNAYFASKIGIGIQSPVQTLDIVGTGRLSSTLTLSSIGACAGSQALQTNGSGDVSCGNITVSGASTGGGWTTDNIGHVTLATTTDAVGIGATTTPYAKLSIISSSAASTTLALRPASAATANIIDIYNTSGSLASVFTADQKLGIGVSSPSVSLDVNGQANLVNLLTTASSTLQNFTALKSTSTNATTTSFALSSIASSILKTNANGSVIPAIAGTDYLASAITALGPTGQTQTGSTQTLATSTSGSDFTITASGDTQTFNLPFSSATANGKLSSTDWSIFNNKISSSSLSGTDPITYSSATGAIGFNFGFNGTYTGANIFDNITRSTTTQATSTSFFSTTASSTNLFSSLLTVGGTGLVVDSNRNVGIGTVNPSARLDINGYGTPVFSSSALLVKVDVNAASGIEFKNINTETAADIRLVAVASDGSYFALAQPGIGNTGTMFGLNRNTTSLLFNIANGGAERDLAIGTLGAKDLVFGTNSLEQMRISSAGNLGIGTTSPYAKLSVVGEAVAANFTATTTANNTFPNLLFTSATGTRATTTSLSISSIASSILKTNANGSVIPAIAGTDYLASAITSLGPTGQTQTGSTQTLATSTSGSDFTITASGDTQTFNLPFSSATANGKLSSTDWSIFNNKISSSSLSGTDPITYSSATGAIGFNFGFNGTYTGANIFDNITRSTTTNATTTNLFSTTASSTNLFSSLLTVGGSALVVNSSRNVGIGTASPTQLLHLSATTPVLKIQSSDNGSSYVRLDEQGDALGGYIQYNGANNVFNIGVNNGCCQGFEGDNPAISILRSNGNVGIGTTSPYAKLSVVGEAVASHFTATTTANNTFPNLLFTSATGTRATTTSFFSTTASSTNLFTTNFNLGNGIIGNGTTTNATTTTFAVIGNATTTFANGISISSGCFAVGGSCVGGGGTAWSSITNPTDTLSLNMGVNPTSFNWTSGTGASELFSLTTDASANGIGSLLYVQTGVSSAVKPLRVLAGNTEALAVNTSGDVGIGNASPSYKLDVTGNGHFTSFVDASYLVATSSTASTFVGGFSSLASSTLQNFTAQNSTSTSATTTSFFSTTASSTNLFSSLLNVGSNALTVNSSGNVGIGTAAPGAKLQVTASAGAVGAKFYSNDNSAVTDGLVFIHSDEALAPFTALNVRQDGTGDILNLFDGTTEVLTVIDGGNVGIGTTSPYAKLSVVGEAVAANFTATTTANNTFPNLIFTSATGTRATTTSFFSTTASTTNLFSSLLTVGSNALTVNSSGQVGVGTSSPFAKFAVNPVAGDTNQFVVGSSTRTSFVINSSNQVIIGANQTTSSFYDFELFGRSTGSAIALRQASDDTSAPGFVLLKSRGTHESPTAVVDGDAIGQIVMRALNPAGGFLSTAAIQAKVNGTVSSNNIPTDLIFLTGSTGAFEKARLTSTGNLGIGTSSPYAKLSVVGEAVAANFTATTTANNTFPNLIFTRATGTSATTTSFAISSIASSILKTNANGSVIPAIAGTDYLASAITALGPTGQTQTGSTQTLATSTTGTDFTITATGNTQTFNLPFSSATANGKLSSTDFSLFNNKISSSSLSGTDPITYSAVSGAIGFNFGFNGTYTGANIFDNITRSTTTSATTTNAFVTSLLSTSATSSSLFSTTASSTNLFSSLLTVGGNGLVVDSSRNVGIGTNSPAGSLHIFESSSGATPDTQADSLVIEENGSTGLSFLLGPSSSGAIYFGDSGGNQQGKIVYDNFDDSLLFGTNGVIRLKVDSTGNLGIGTSSPYAKLSVVGEAVAANFTATTTSNNTFPNLIFTRATGTQATTTNFSISSIASSILKTNANGSVIPAIAGTDYLASAITSIGPSGQTQTGSTQTLATSTSGSDFTITATGDTQTFNLPFSSATANGKLSSTDWSSFNNKVSSTSLSGTDPITYSSATGAIGFNFGFNGTYTGANIFNNITRSTTTQATTTSLFSTTASSTNLFSSLLTVGGNALTVNSSRNVGIGTAAPDTKLSIFQSTGAAGDLLHLRDSSDGADLVVRYDGSGRFLWLDGTGGSGDIELVIDVSSDRVGIGTTSPYAKLSVVGPVVAEYFHATSTTATSSFLGAFSIGSTTPAGRSFFSVGTSSPLILADKNTSTLELGYAGAGNIIFETKANTPNQVLVGIGTTTPDADIAIVSSQTANNTYIFTVSTTTGDVINRRFTIDSDGDVAYDGSLTSPADYAEAFTVVGTKTDFEPGDLVTLSPDEAGKVEKSSVPYQNNIVGIYSTKPGIIGTLALDITDYKLETSNDIPVAVLGRVPAKVSAENGPIKVGDKITSSSIPGVGMKATQGGESVGIALEAYDGSASTTSKILVLVNPVYIAGNLANATSTSSTNNLYSTFINQVSGGISNIWQVATSFISSIATSVWDSATSMLASASKLRVSSQNTDSVDYETYNLQTSRQEITVSGSDVLVSGNGGAYARIRFDESFSSLVDPDAPLRVIVTPTGVVQNPLYVYEKTQFGFEVRSENSSDSNVTFDWLVIARKAGDYDSSEDPAVPSANYGSPAIADLIEPESSSEPERPEPAEGRTSSSSPSDTDTDSNATSTPSTDSTSSLQTGSGQATSTDSTSSPQATSTTNTTSSTSTPPADDTANTEQSTPDQGIVEEAPPPEVSADTGDTNTESVSSEDSTSTDS